MLYSVLTSIFECRNENHCSASMGRARHLTACGMYNEAHEILAAVVVAHPGFVPPLVERIRVYLADHDWDRMLEAANR